MGWNDHMDDSELGNLPPEAHANAEGQPFDPDDGWLRTAEPNQQLIAMREWFLARYCDPVHDTPYDGGEGGYLFIHGGPYDPADEIPTRFARSVSDDLIDEVVDEMHAQHDDQWAPVHWDPPEEYDARYDLHIVTVSEPLRRLRERLQQSQQVLSLQGDAEARSLAEKLVFGAAIGALEAFLYETVAFWVETDDTVMRDCITKLPAFKDEQMKLSDIFDRQAGLKNHVKGYLQNLVWHKWDKVVPLFKHGLGIALPSMKVFDGALLKRHDIVHRSGHDKRGEPTVVTVDEIADLCFRIERFGAEVDRLLESRRIIQSFPLVVPASEGA
jgi:hypothetical protein